MTKGRKLKYWFLAARPKTLLASIAPVAIGTSLAWHDQQFHGLHALACLAGAMAIQIATNFCNDYFDFQQGADRASRVGPPRAVASGWIRPPAVLQAAVITFGVALVISSYLAYQVHWAFFVLAVVSVLCGIWYTAGRYALAYLGLGEPFVLVFFGPVAVGGTYFAQAQQLRWPVLVAGLAPGLLSVALLAVNNLRDIEEDTLAGKRTLAVRWGRRFARWEYVLCIVVALLVPAVLSIGLDLPASVCLASLAAIVAIPACLIAWHQQGEPLNRVLGLTALTLLIYSLLFSIGLIG